MKTIKVSINGFGRIGRAFLKVAWERPEIEIVAVNDLGDIANMAYLLKYDTVYREWKHDIKVDGQNLIINGKIIKVLTEKDPNKLPWKDLEIDVVVESTGLFTNYEKAKVHLDAGARKVVISAPAKGEGEGVLGETILLGVNEEKFGTCDITSNASCTTNCLAPVAKVILENFGIARGLMTTIHSYTNDQKILDLPHKDLRRARAAALSMIPTTTGAASAVSLVLPELKGKLDGLAIRVPTPNVSLVDLVVDVEKDTTVEEVNAALKKAADGKLKGILQFCEEELVSRDFNGNDHSSIVDAATTTVIDKRMVKVLSWYDNEWGYSSRMRDLAVYIAKKL
ncbi:MAG: glyceraldehyde-3-phosphate dehydrogenase [Deltaproteobacteria bacterium]|nr:glyceraldehyde-3-phosphate dehydrogenase [Deltaproteobacteria bacterium]